MEIKKLVVLSINKELGYIRDIKKDLEPYTLGLKRSLWRKKFTNLWKLVKSILRENSNGNERPIAKKY